MMLHYLFLAVAATCVVESMRAQDDVLSETKGCTAGSPCGLVVYSDVDDTTTCPARKDKSRNLKEKATAFLAGVDSCGHSDKGSHDEAMKHSEIYFGYGAFVQMLAYGVQGNAEWRIVSANPTKRTSGPKAYPYIEEYMKRVASSCDARKEDDVMAVIQVGDENGYVDRGSASSRLEYERMGVRKLDQLLRNTDRKSPDKAVFLGDTGQGDVCAGVCFVDPQNCHTNAKMFYKKVRGKLAWMKYKDAYEVNTHQVKTGQKRFALFHNVGSPGITPLLQECLNNAGKMPNIGFYGNPDRTGTPRNDYIKPDDVNSALSVAINIKAIPEEARSFMTKDDEDGRPLWEKECIPSSQWEFRLYRSGDHVHEWEDHASTPDEEKEEAVDDEEDEEDDEGGGESRLSSSAALRSV